MPREAFKDSVEEMIGTNREQRMRFYAGPEVPPLDEKAFPAAERLTPNWAIYRWLQVNLLMGVGWPVATRMSDRFGG
jgi:hypothetical protein